MRPALALVAVALLCPPLLAGWEVHNGQVSNLGAPLLQEVAIPRFDDHGGTRRLDSVHFDFATSLFCNGTTNGTGATTHVVAQLEAIWSREGVHIQKTLTRIDAVLINTGPPNPYTTSDADHEHVDVALAPYVGTGDLLHQVRTEFFSYEEPAGSTGFVAVPYVEWWVVYTYTALDEGFCYGDGTESACPCGNFGLPGRGCDNAQATGGVRLESNAFAPNGSGGGTVQLQGSGFPPTAHPAVVAIRANAAAASPVVFGDGLRCISTTGFARVGSRLAIDGLASIPLVHGAGPGSFSYQLWYRNNPASFCDAGAGFNLSNAWQLTW